MKEKAILAAGCFWGVEAEFVRTKGIVSTRVGYTGGSLENPTYEKVCTDKTGHAEAIEIIFNPDEISYENILGIFFQIHDPTSLNKQGPDIGSQYRSEIFYLNEAQKEIAQKVKSKLVKKGIKIVTPITKAGIFYEAEEYHQKYFEKNPNTACSLKLE